MDNDNGKKWEPRCEVVASPLIVKEGKILLIKSPKWGDAYLVPGGHVEFGETAAEAAQREGEEETGLKLKPLYCVNVGELIFDPSFHRKSHLLYVHYVCEITGGELKLDEKELNEFLWIEPRQALKLKLTSGVRETLENYLKGVKIAVTSHKFS